MTTNSDRNISFYGKGYLKYNDHITTSPMSTRHLHKESFGYLTMVVSKGDWSDKPQSIDFRVDETFVLTRSLWNIK